MRNTPPTPRRTRPAHESKSASVRAAAAAPSRRQQSKWHREQHQQRALYLAIGVLVVLVLAVFGGGILYDNVVRANEVVAQVGPDAITASQLLEHVRPAVGALDAQAKLVGGGASASSIASYVDQQKRSLPDQTLNTMIDQKIVEQEAARRNINVSPAELDDKERQTVADFQNSISATPTPAPTTSPADAATADAAAAAGDATPGVASTPAGAADAAAGSTPQAGAQSTPAAGAQVTPAAGAVDTSATPLATPTAAGTPTPIPTPTAVPTLEDAAYGSALQQLLDRNNLTEADFRDRLQQSMLRDRVLAAVGQDQVPDTQDQIHARKIVVADQDAANTILTQLQGGADFAQLAQQSSTDAATKDQGGDMGWVAQSALDKPLADAAFALQPPQLTGVVQGTAGFTILQLLERDPARPVPADQLTTQRAKAGSDWLSSSQTGPSVKLQLTQADRDWILARIGVRP